VNHSNSNEDGIAIYGRASDEDYYGYGVYGEGGYVGVEGDVYPTGSDDYYGVYGYVSGGDGYNYALAGDAYGDGENYGVYAYAMDNGSETSTNYGIYATASGGAINWAGYFDGDVNIENDLYLNGGLDDGTGFGTSGQYLRTDGSDVFWANLSGSLIQMDTLRSVNGADADTIWAMSQFYVNGELIADSIQAVGDTVFVDDNTSIDGNLLVSDSVGIGVAAPQYKLHAEDSTGAGDAVGYFVNHSAGTADGIAVYGQATDEDGYGYGVYGEGGNVGVMGGVHPTGSNDYSGVHGYVIGGNGYNAGLVGEAYGDGVNFGVRAVAMDNGSGLSTNYGIYARASGGATNWAGYFDQGNVNIRNNLYLNGGLNDGTGFGSPGQFLASTGSDVVWAYLTVPFMQFDTLKSLLGNPTDTIWTLAQFYINGELIADSMQAVGDTIFIDDNLKVNDSLVVSGDVYVSRNVLVDNGNRYYGVDATQADSFWIYDDGDTTRFDAENPIKIGHNSLVVGTSGNVSVVGGVYVPIVTVAADANYTIASTDYTILVNTGTDGTNTTITLPDATTSTGRIIVIKQIAGSDNIDLVTTGTQTVDGVDDPTGVLGTVNYAITLQSDGSNWYIISEKRTP